MQQKTTCSTISQKLSSSSNIPVLCHLQDGQLLQVTLKNQHNLYMIRHKNFVIIHLIKVHIWFNFFVWIYKWQTKTTLGQHRQSVIERGKSTICHFA